MWTEWARGGKKKAIQDRGKKIPKRQVQTLFFVRTSIFVSWQVVREREMHINSTCGEMRRYLEGERDRGGISERETGGVGFWKGRQAVDLGGKKKPRPSKKISAHGFEFF